MLEMYYAGVSMRRVEDITEALWGTRVSASTVSELNQKIAGQIEAWRHQPIEGEHAYVFLDGLWLKRSWGGEVRNVSVLVAIGVNQDGFREVLGVCEGTKEDKASWQAFLRHLKARGLKGVKLFIGDKCLGLVESLGEFYPETAYQRCVVHFYRNVWSLVPSTKVRPIATMLKAIHASEDRGSARGKVLQVVAKLHEMKLPSAAEFVRDHVEETFSYFAFPSEHWRSLRTNNPLERIMREIRRRTRVVGAFPDGNSALLLISARLRYIAGNGVGGDCAPSVAPEACRANGSHLGVRLSADRASSFTSGRKEWPMMDYRKERPNRPDLVSTHDNSTSVWPAPASWKRRSIRRRGSPCPPNQHL